MKQPLSQSSQISQPSQILPSPKLLSQMSQFKTVPDSNKAKTPVPSPKSQTPYSRTDIHSYIEFGGSLTTPLNISMVDTTVGVGPGDM